MRVAYWRGIVLGSGLLVGLAACGADSGPTATFAPPPATRATTSAPTRISLPPLPAPALPATATTVPPSTTEVPATATTVSATATAVPATVTTLPATATGLPAPATPARPLPTATPQSAIRNPQSSVRPSATEEPEDCFQSVGGVYHWMDVVNSPPPGDRHEIEAGLLGACVDNRRLALWALGSVHEAAGGVLLDRYLAAHPAGDWVRDEYDLRPVAQAARAYLSAPQTKIDTYAVRPISIYSAIPQYDSDGQALTAPVGQIAPGTRLTRLERVPTDRTRPDHGGDTALVFERVQPAGDNRVYFMDISPYVALDPAYFVPPSAAQP